MPAPSVNRTPATEAMKSSQRICTPPAASIGRSPCELPCVARSRPGRSRCVALRRRQPPHSAQPDPIGPGHPVSGYLVERFLPARETDSPEHLNTVMADLQMMVQLGSRERTLAEYRALLEQAGFEFRGSPPGPLSGVVEGVAS